MSLQEYKITDAAIAQKGVTAAPDKLTGTAAQNKAVFDRLIRESVKTLFNGLIDALSNAGGAADIGATEIEGVTGGDVQTMLGSVKTILDTKAGSSEMAAALALKSDKSVTDLHIRSITLNAETGVFTFTREDGSFFTIDTVLEKVATNWRYDPATQSLALTLADGTTQSVPLSAFITETEFEDSAQIAFSVSDHKVAATVRAGGITDTMLSSALIEQLQGYVSAAAGSATNAAQSETAAELYRSQAAASASAAAQSETDAAASRDAAAICESNVAASVSAAGLSAGSAASSAAEAEDSAEDAEAWAVGQRGGVDVDSSDPTYHNNARYYKEQAEAASGVTPEDKARWNAKQDALTFDAAPAENSTNPVTSGGVFTALQTLKTSVSSGKALVAAAVTDKGIPTAATDSFDVIAANIEQIKTGSGSSIVFSSPTDFTLRVKDGTKHWDGVLEWTDGNADWAIWDGTATLSSADGLLYLRGTGNTVITGKNSGNFAWMINGSNVSCVGNIELLLDYETVAAGEHPAMGNYCFEELFDGTAALIKAPRLPATALTTECYSYMLEATSITRAPELPATTLAQNCYLGMFKNCTSLVTAPELPATTLAEDCYGAMFSGCTALTAAPVLPATTLAKNCYESMFIGCTSLATAPVLPATTLTGGCYSSMFKNCRSLATAPALPATTMEQYCYSLMFCGCTALTTAPELPAITLAMACYSQMFVGCTSLATAPVLPATTLTKYCYYLMFSSCTKIKLSTSQTGEYQYPYRIPKDGAGTMGQDALKNMFSNTGGTFTGTPTINTTYYTDYAPVG